MIGSIILTSKTSRTYVHILARDMPVTRDAGCYSVRWFCLGQDYNQIVEVRVTTTSDCANKRFLLQIERTVYVQQAATTRAVPGILQNYMKESASAADGQIHSSCHAHDVFDTGGKHEAMSPEGAHKRNPFLQPHFILLESQYLQK